MPSSGVAPEASTDSKQAGFVESHEWSLVGLLAVLGGTLATMMTATIAGVLTSIA